MSLIIALTLLLLLSHDGAWVAGGMKIVILYPLVPATELTFLTDVVCNTNPAVAHFTALMPNGNTPGFPTRCFHDVIHTAVLSETEKFQSITNSHVARMWSVKQYRGENSNIDILAAAMEHADMVWTGPLVPLLHYHVFIDHIIDMLPLRPLVMSFSQSLLNATILETVEYSSFFSLLVQASGYPTYSKNYRFNMSSTLQCLASNPSGGCRDILPPDINSFVQSLVTGTRLSLLNQLPQAPPVLGGMCHEGNPEVFGAEGMNVINSLVADGSAATTVPPRVMCFTYSYEVKHANVKAIRDTWGKRCDGYLAISNISKEEDGIYALGPLDQEENQTDWFEGDSYSRMWTKTQLIINLVATTGLLDDYDFFLLGGDDLYVLVDNLKAFLSSERIAAMADEPLYLGREIHANNYTRFNSGGAGYVLNRAAALVLYRLIHSPSGDCLPSALSSMEDLFVGKCLLEAGIAPIDTRNAEDGREMFHPISPRYAFLGRNGGDDDWYQRMALTSLAGPECCSRHSISFHYVTAPEDLYCLDWLIYSSQ